MADHIPSVIPGVFFDASDAALPRGPQALPRDDVRAEQRERLMAALTELIAAGGYSSATIGALATRAKVSRSAFYACFPDKRACALAAYRRFIEVFLAEMSRRAALATDIPELIAAMLDGYLSTLGRDLVATRAFLVEFDALGNEAREQRRAAVRGIAAYVRRTHEQFRTADPALSPPFAAEVYQGIVYMVRQLTVDALDEHPSPDLSAIGDGLAPWLLAAFRTGALESPDPGAGSAHAR